MRRLTLPILAASLLLGGCAQAPWNRLVDVEPLAIPEPPPATADGAIYQPQHNAMAWFEDRRPRNIGDVITIKLDESVNASKSLSANSARTGSTGLEVGDLAEALEVLGEYGFNMSSNSEFDAAGGAAASNEFTGTITVQVHQIYPNGNLFVVGEKKIAINQGTEYIRFSGIVNPRNISGTNTIASSEVANAQIEYVGDGYIAESQRMGWFQRLWMNINPF